MKTKYGIVSHPRHGRDADALLAAASALARKEPLIRGLTHAVIQEESMKNLYRLAERIGAGEINVLVLGETGVGKQVLAEAIHSASARRDKLFLELNCSAFSDTLLDSELFGHAKGAFTGATHAKKGLLETADGGTVFLDEIGDMPLSLQAKLLRVIENGQVLPVGGLQPQSIDVRFVAATNRDLEQEIIRGTFRQDLFFRIGGVTLEVPPLRDRKSEVRPLAEMFLRRFAGDRRLTISSAAMEWLREYGWPGNIRELRNVIERATLLAMGSKITPEHLPLDKMSTTTMASAESLPRLLRPSADRAMAPAKRPDDDTERQRVIDALMVCGGNNTEAAKRLGISRRTLGKWLDRYKIPRPRKGSRK